MSVLALFTISMLSCLIPKNFLQNNIEKSAGILEEEGQYPKGPLRIRSTTLDNFTDSLILNVAYSAGENKNVLVEAASNRYYSNGRDDMVKNLSEVASDEHEANVDYSRYWFGTAVIVRFLMVAFDYSSIRIILTISLSLLSILALLKLAKAFGINIAFAFGIALISLRMFMIGYSLQFSPVMFITIGVMIAVLWSRKENYTFLFSGILTAFFDLLTFPIVSLGFPLVVLLLKELKAKRSRKLILRKLVGSAVFWGGGYFGSYLMKFLISGIILGKDAALSAFGQASYRAGGHLSEMIQALLRNGGTMFGIWTAGIPLFILIVWFVYALKRGSLKKHWRDYIPFLLIAALPHVWYLIFSNHSMVHFWFTYRAQAVSVFAVLCGMLYFAEDKNG